MCCLIAIIFLASYFFIAGLSQKISASVIGELNFGLFSFSS